MSGARRGPSRNHEWRSACVLSRQRCFRGPGSPGASCTPTWVRWVHEAVRSTCAKRRGRRYGDIIGSAIVRKGAGTPKATATARSERTGSRGGLRPGRSMDPPGAGVIGRAGGRSWCAPKQGFCVVMGRRRFAPSIGRGSRVRRASGGERGLLGLQGWGSGEQVPQRSSI